VGAGVGAGLEAPEGVVGACVVIVAWVVIGRGGRKRRGGGGGGSGLQGKIAWEGVEGVQQRPHPGLHSNPNSSPGSRKSRPITPCPRSAKTKQ
jgi:hypothetical protein